MTSLVIQLGRNSKEPHRLSFRVVEGEEINGLVRESQACLRAKEFLEGLIGSNIDPDLKSQYEITMTFTKVGKGIIKQRVDFRWVPNSGCDQFVLSVGRPLYEALKEICAGKGVRYSLRSK